MSEIFNYHGLFQNATDNSFIKKLDLTTKCESSLEDAVKKVKDALRPSLYALAQKFGVEQQFANPQFRLQGSAVYKTQNAPAHPPIQQVDVDLGVYLSAAFLHSASQGNGQASTLPAKELAHLYFETVDTILRKLCTREGWTFVDGSKSRSTCCRLDLSPTGVDAHIDVPLYAAPSEQFKTFLRTLALDGLKAESGGRPDLAPQIDTDGWDELKVVVMATRDGEWAESDVQIVIQHFRDVAKASEHPYRLKRIWRYVKAWRDFAWPVGGPSSILLMEIVSRILDRNVTEVADLLESGRDDKLLAFTMKALSDHFRDNVVVKWGTVPESLNKADTATRDSWIKGAINCYETLYRCSHDSSLTTAQVISLVRQQFGQRIPNDIDLVKVAVRASPAVITSPKHHPSPQERIHRTEGA